jgi:hypothetical protein
VVQPLQSAVVPILVRPPEYFIYGCVFRASNTQWPNRLRLLTADHRNMPNLHPDNIATSFTEDAFAFIVQKPIC